MSAPITLTFQFSDGTSHDASVTQASISHDKDYNYSNLVIQIKLAFTEKFKTSIGDNKTKEFITYCKNNDWLIQEKDKAPYKLGSFKV